MILKFNKGILSNLSVVFGGFVADNPDKDINLITGNKFYKKLNCKCEDKIISFEFSDKQNLVIEDSFSKVELYENWNEESLTLESFKLILDKLYKFNKYFEKYKPLTDLIESIEEDELSIRFLVNFLEDDGVYASLKFKDTTIAVDFREESFDITFIEKEDLVISEISNIAYSNIGYNFNTFLDKFNKQVKEAEKSNSISNKLRDKFTKEIKPYVIDKFSNSPIIDKILKSVNTKIIPGEDILFLYSPEGSNEKYYFYKDGNVYKETIFETGTSIERDRVKLSEEDKDKIIKEMVDSFE